MRYQWIDLARFKVGTLLFVVAVVAVNCWAFRRLYEQGRWYSFRNPWFMVPNLYLGVLPLANVALIGATCTVARWLRRLRYGRSANSRSASSAVTYFSLHFLVLCWLASLFVPAAADCCWRVLEPTLRLAAIGWALVFGQPEATVPWIIFACSVLGLGISGPPLLLAWIGQVLARRCAATLPRRRFRALACLVSLGFASGDLAIGLTPRPFRDSEEVDLDFQVVDLASGRPIATAFLWLTDPFDRLPNSIPPRGLTDRAGRARLSSRFVVRGEQNAFCTMGVCSTWGRWLEVSAADQRTVRVPLTRVLGPFIDPARPGLGKVVLDRGPTPEPRFRDLAGIYLNQDGLGCRLEIEPDGRFAWHVLVGILGTVEYGYLKRHDGEIELAPIPHPGREIHLAMAYRYRLVEWDDRRYLSATDELDDFCRQVVAPNHPSHFRETYGTLPRLSDDGKPRSGLPRLPLRVWVRFLTDELSRHDESGMLRLALATLVPRILRDGWALSTGSAAGR